MVILPYSTYFLLQESTCFYAKKKWYDLTVPLLLNIFFYNLKSSADNFDVLSFIG